MPPLIEVIEFLDDTGTIMVARVPQQGETEIKWGAQLTVRESQNAIFFRDGKAVAVFNRPGRYVLKTQNIPALTKLVTRYAYGPTSPFRAEVYFLNMKLFRNLKWGTRDPVIFRDPELQMIRLRSHGVFSIQIADPSVFLNKVVGTQGIFTDADIQDYLKNIIVSRLIDVLGTNIKTIFDLPKVYDELSVAAKALLAANFEAVGLNLVDFFINSITPPDEVQKAIDERSSMQAIGDMDKYMQFKTARAIQDAANQSGGTAGAGVGLGAGMGMGMMIPDIMRRAQENTRSSPPPNGPATDPLESVKQLKALLDSGAISEDEYNRKKDELLRKI
jgi:membrane protease subunit (stomatin/prohibitin family)